MNAIEIEQFKTEEFKANLEKAKGTYAKMVNQYLDQLKHSKTVQKNFEQSSYKGEKEYQSIYNAASKLIFAGKKVILAAKNITKYELLSGLHDDNPLSSSSIYANSVIEAKKHIANLNESEK
jgi:fructose-1,6-bisphosphatase/sedoheptulose 1,7-bisphosphatase-like protein